MTTTGLARARERSTQPPDADSVHLDADTPAGRALHATAARGGVACWAAAASLFAGAGSPPGAVSAAGVLRALDRFGAAAPGQARHPALAAALAVLPGAVADGPVRVGEVAARAGVSASRLGHLFAEQLGWSFPAGVRWARLHAAIAAPGGGRRAAGGGRRAAGGGRRAAGRTPPRPRTPPGSRTAPT